MIDDSLVHLQKLLQTDPIFEDLILNEMPDVGPLRLRAFEQRSLPRDERDYDLEEAAADDLTAYVRSRKRIDIDSTHFSSCRNFPFLPTMF